MKKYTEIPVDWQDSDLLKEWPLVDKMIHDVEEVILALFDGELVVDRDKEEYIPNHTRLQEFFGLPYTSSSECAGIWNTNAEHEFEPGIFTQGFALTEELDVILIAHTHGTPEIEHWYNIGSIKS